MIMHADILGRVPIGARSINLSGCMSGSRLSLDFGGGQLAIVLSS